MALILREDKEAPNSNVNATHISPVSTGHLDKQQRFKEGTKISVTKSVDD